MNKEHLHPDGRPYTKEEFVEKIKTDKEFAKRFGNLGKIYGYQWRNWNDNIDQISDLIKQLKENPDSRRLLVSAWNASDLPHQVLPPCHYGFQVYTRELSIEERVAIFNEKKEKGEIIVPEFKSVGDSNAWTSRLLDNVIPERAISLMWNQRSVDTFLGLPFNIASYGLLLEIIAKAVNMVPDELIGNLGDVHLYSNHIEQAREQIGRRYTTEERHNMLKESMGDFYQTAVDEQVPFGGGLSEYYVSYNIPLQTREPYKLPTLVHMKTDEFYKSLSESISLFTHLDPTDFQVENYKSHSKINAPLSN
jgi:thymidylate synthase